MKSSFFPVYFPRQIKFFLVVWYSSLVKKPSRFSQKHQQLFSIEPPFCGYLYKTYFLLLPRSYIIISCKSNFQHFIQIIKQSKDLRCLTTLRELFCLNDYKAPILCTFMYIWCKCTQKLKYCLCVSQYRKIFSFWFTISCQNINIHRFALNSMS